MKQKQNQRMENLESRVDGLEKMVWKVCRMTIESDPPKTISDRYYIGPEMFTVGLDEVVRAMLKRAGEKVVFVKAPPHDNIQIREEQKEAK